MPIPKDKYPKPERRYPDHEPDELPPSAQELLMDAAWRDLNQGNWANAERGFVSILTQGGTRSDSASTAVLGVAQARLLGRLDTRGAFAMLQSSLDMAPSLDTFSGRNSGSARLHILAAMLFATPEPGLCDPARARAHLQRTRRLLESSPDPDLLALAGVAEIHATEALAEVRRSLGPPNHGPTSELARLGEVLSADLAAAEAPVTRCLALEAASWLPNTLDREHRPAEVALEALEQARKLNFYACEARLFLRSARLAFNAGIERTLALEHLLHADRALSKALAENSWLQRAVNETRQMMQACAAPTGVSASVLSIPAAPAAPSPAEADSVVFRPSASRRGHGIEEQIARLAPSRVTVLLVGPSASVRDQVARALHSRSTHAAGPFVIVDCFESDPRSLEDRLFGGPGYGGAVGGAALEAETGTLHVSGVEGMPLLIQPRFLRFLDTASDVRVIASSSEDLSSRIRAGTFRQDLGERLSLIQLVLPGRLESV